MSLTLQEAGAPLTAVDPTPVAPTQDAPWDSRWLPALVLIAAILAGAIVYAWFWQHSEGLWWSMTHDRHAHYMNSLDLAFDLRTGNLVRLFHDFDRLRVWGPLYVVMVGLVELVGGPDHRLAVLPSVAGWVLTMWFAFLIPRRLLTTGGNAAGLIAAFLVAVSPAHRAFATDCMYESLGAGLSLAALYSYLVVLQDRTGRAIVLLATTLTLLFLHKYNYWLLIIFGLTLGEFARQPRAWLLFGRSLCRPDRLPRWLLDEVKHPLNYLTLALVVAALVVIKTGGTTLDLGGWKVSLQTPHNIIHLAYVSFFIRLVLWWRKTGKVWSLELPPALRGVLVWHGGVVAFWFLLPKRLSYFIWFLSPANSDQHHDVTFMHGLPFYLQGLQDDYLPLSWGFYLFVVMLALGLLVWGKLKPGASALMFFFLVSVYLSCQHPMLKNRYIHSWIAATWVIGAVGLVFAVQRLAGLVSRDCRPWAAGLACVLLIGLHGPALLEPGRAQEGGVKENLPSPLRITDTYLGSLADAKSPTILSNVSTRFLLTWTFIERHRHQHFASEIKNFQSFESDPDRIGRWLESTRSDALVLIDIRPGTTYDWKTDENVDLATLEMVLAGQKAWVVDRRWELPEGVSITLWKKGG